MSVAELQRRMEIRKMFNRMVNDRLRYRKALLKVRDAYRRWAPPDDGNRRIRAEWLDLLDKAIDGEGED